MYASKIKYFQDRCEEAFNHLNTATRLLKNEGEVTHIQDYHRISVLVRACVKADSVDFHFNEYEYLNDSLDYKRRGDEALEVIDETEV